MTQWIEAEKWGQAPGLLGPPNLDYIYRDPNKELKIYLMEHVGPKLISIRVANRDRHWMVGWTVNVGVESSHLRFLNIETFPGRKDYTYWGPVTAHARDSYKSHYLGTLTLEQRKRLEELSWKVKVYVPNGEWNCQDWIKDLLESAVLEGLFTREQVDTALATVNSSSGE
jgi:hypothetical protein